MDEQAVIADAALMGRVANDDPAASRAVVDAHLKGVVAFAWRMVGDHATAEDVAQDAFLKLWRQAPKWKPKAQIGTWLRRVAYNRCIDLYRRTRPTDDVTGDGAGKIQPLDRPGSLLAEEVSVIVRSALDGLPERQRAGAGPGPHFEGIEQH